MRWRRCAVRYYLLGSSRTGMTSRTGGGFIHPIHPIHSFSFIHSFTHQQHPLSAFLIPPPPDLSHDKKQLICLLSTPCLLHSLRNFQVHLPVTSHHIDLLLLLSLFLLLLLLPSSFPSSFLLSLFYTDSLLLQAPAIMSSAEDIDAAR